MAVNDLLKVVPTIQAASLLDYNVRFAKKKKKKARDFLEVGVTNVVGTRIIKATDDFLWG